MADIQKTVEIVFGGQDKVSSMIRGLDQDLDLMAAPLANAAERVLKLDVAMAAMAIGGLAYAVKQAGDFETSFDKVALRINASDSEIQKFKDDVLAYGADSTFSL